MGPHPIYIYNIYIYMYNTLVPGSTDFILHQPLIFQVSCQLSPRLSRLRLHCTVNSVALLLAGGCSVERCEVDVADGLMGWKSEVDIDLYNGIYVIHKVWHICIHLWHIHWVWPPPSNSDHQDYCIFSRGSL